MPVLFQRHPVQCAAPPTSRSTLAEAGSAGAVVQSFISEGGPMRVQQQMSTALITVGPGDTVATAHQRLKETGLRCLPVTHEGRLLGLVLGGQPAFEAAMADTLVQAVMQPPIVSLPPNAQIDRAARLMLQHDVRGLPVVGEDGQLVGILTVSNLLDAIVRSPPIVLW
jgi:acetoin utilization protein AcuB